jgi:hypothetical protein
MENPTLWVWGIVVGLMIAGKFAYRWKTTKQLAKEMGQRSSSKAMVDNRDKNSNNNTRTSMSHKYSRHKYSPISFKNYFEIRERIRRLNL